MVDNVQLCLNTKGAIDQYAYGSAEASSDDTCEAGNIVRQPKYDALLRRIYFKSYCPHYKVSIVCGEVIVNEPLVAVMA